MHNQVLHGLTARLLFASIAFATTLCPTQSRAEDAMKVADNTTKVTIAKEPITKVAEIEGISEYQLENGARVLLFPDASKDVVTVNMTVLVGSRHEGYGEAGMAHLLEHMLFKGTPMHRDIPKVLKDMGATFNGTTSVDRTNYYETLPASTEALEFAIRLEADRLVNSFVNDADLQSEMTVVRNEFERGENDPFSVLLQRMTSAAYEWHNYGKSTIGNRSDIERVPIVRLREFYRKFYRPDNVILIIGGKFDPEKALQYADHYLGSIPRPDVPIDDTYTTEPAQDGERTVVLRRVGNTQVVGALYHIPAGSHPDFAAMRILTHVLADEPNGRLYKSLVKADLAANVFAFARPTFDPGSFITLAQAREEQSLELLRQTMLTTIEQGFLDAPVTPEELERARQKILKQRELEANSTDALSVSLSNWAAQGDWRLYFLFRDIVESLTVEQVQQVAERYLVRNNRTVGLYIPAEKAERVKIPESPDLNNVLADYKGREAIAEGEAFEASLQNIENRTERGQLTAGIKYAFLPKKNRGETLSLLLTLRYGNEETLKGKLTLTEVTPLMLSRGTERLDYGQLQDELTRLRAELRISGQPGLVQISLKTTRPNLEQVLDLLGEIIRKPRFGAEELDVIRRQALTALQQSKNDPQTLAALSTQRALAPFPADDVRYVPTLQEELERTKSLTIEQVREFYRDFISGQAGELAVVGDFEPNLIKEKLTPVLEGWSSEIPYRRVARTAFTEIAGRTLEIETPDKANAVYFAAKQIAISDAHQDYAELTLANFVLGGGALSSRLGTRVRQQEGLSYGVASSLSGSAQDQRTDFSLYAISNPENKERLVSVIEEVLVNFKKHGMTADELAAGKEGFLQQQAVARNDDRRMALLLVSSLFNDRKMQFYIDQEAEIANATLEEVNKVVQTHLDPKRLIISLAGDFAGVAAATE
jgi:zinc protease